MAQLDLGKQMGPLPLGAWVAVVGAGLGIAVYTRRQSSSGPQVVEDTSGVPGVGAGASGQWTDVTVPTTGQPTAITYADNDAWGKAAIDRLVAENYNPNLVYSAITKALAGGTGDNKLSIQEYAVLSRALVLLKAPPTPLTIPSAPTVPVPVVTPPKPATPAKAWRSYRTHLSRDNIQAITDRANPGTSAAIRLSYAMQAAGRSRLPRTKNLRPGTWVNYFGRQIA